MISGTGGLNKTGSSMFTVSGLNTYTGVTYIEEGTLRLGIGGGLASPAILLGPNATFDLSGNNVTLSYGLFSSVDPGTVRLGE